MWLLRTYSAGKETKVSFDFCCLFLLSPKSNAIAPLLSQCRRGDGDLSTGEVWQVVIPEKEKGGIAKQGEIEGAVCFHDFIFKNLFKFKF